MTMFEEDYKKYGIPNESKPKNIGRPFFLKSLFNKYGVILVHGYLAAPEEIRVLARFPEQKGIYRVRRPAQGPWDISPGPGPENMA